VSDPSAQVSPLRAFARRHLKTPSTVALHRSLAVRETARFVAREWTAPPGRVGRYRLRQGDRWVVVRHRSRDMEVFHELLVSRAYDPPPEARAAMGALRRPRIADLGANIGLFGVRALTLWPQARIDAIEPDPANAGILREVVALNGAAERWSVVEAFAAPQAGTVRFLSGQESYSRAAWDTEVDHVVEVPQVDVFGVLADADLVKIDIEGAEWAILEDDRWGALRPSAVILEYHGRPGVDTHALARAALTRCGLHYRSLHRDDELGIGVLWGWRV